MRKINFPLLLEMDYPGCHHRGSFSDWPEYKEKSTLLASYNRLGCSVSHYN